MLRFWTVMFATAALALPATGQDLETSTTLATQELRHALSDIAEGALPCI